jgi:hypothetical protein
VDHVVFFTGADGASQFRHLGSLDDAVRCVEHLRNVEGVEDPRVFSLTEVPLSFKTVYRVELADGSVPPLPPMPAMPPELEAVAEAAPAEPVAEPVMAAGPSEPFAVVAEPAPSNGKGRGSGFFAR